MATRSTLDDIVGAIASATRPLLVALDSKTSFKTFMATLGWNVDDYISAMAALKPTLEAINDYASASESQRDTASLLVRLGSLFTAINGFGNASVPSTIDATAFRSDFPKQLRDYLIFEYLLHETHGIGHVLLLAGVLRVVHHPATVKRLEYWGREVAWGDFANALTHPAAVFTNAYKWGDPAFDGSAVLENLYRLGYALGLSVSTGSLSNSQFGLSSSGAKTGAIQPIHRSLVRWALVPPGELGIPLSAGLELAVLPETNADKPGLALLPYVKGSESVRFALTTDATLSFGEIAELEGGVGLLIRPGKTPELKLGYLKGAASAGAEFRAEIKLHGSDRFILLGDTASSRFEVGAFTIRSGARVQAGDSVNTSAYLECELRSGALVISTGDSDGFLKKILGDGATVDFSATLGLDSDHGLYFTGSADLEIEIPCHIQLGPIEIHNAAIAIRPSAAGIPIDLTSTISANFGFLNALVENIGITANLSTPAGGGKLGPFDFDIAPRPPDGIGIGIDAGIVQGLGYFYFDREKEEYGGALELTIAELFSVKAFGLVNTRMPKGEKGFSMVVIMALEFPEPGIQLGLGFRLLGVGGLISIQRDLNLDELAQRMRSGTLIRLVYPSSLEGNVLTPLFDELQAVFPVGKSTLLGPFFKLAYGTPTLVDVKLGFIFEIPGNVAIIGVINAALPKAEGAVLKLTASFVGVVEQQRLWFFAMLYGSRLVTYALDGELGLLVAFAGSRAMLLSAGGFHPRYNPPPLPFGTPARLALEILNRDNAKIRAESYFAVWSGGTMFGVRAECYFGFSAFELSGHFGFDCLIRFDPFSFEIDVSASLSAEVFGVGCFSLHIGLHLEGPRPYRASGKVKIAIRCAPDIHKNIDKKWGSDGGQALPQIQIFGMVAAEIDRASNWGTALPAGARLLVSLRDRDENDTAIRVHPSGWLQITQRAVPFDLTIDKVGNQKPSDVKRFELTAMGSLKVNGDVLDQFAAGQYLSLGEAALSRNEFEQMTAGKLFAGSGDELSTGPTVRRRVRYEQIVIDTNHSQNKASKPVHRKRKAFAALPDRLFSHFIRNGSVAQSVLSRSQRTRIEALDQGRVGLIDETFAVALRTDNRAVAADAVAFVSQAAAYDYMRSKMTADPSLRGKLHVIPSQERTAA